MEDAILEIQGNLVVVREMMNRCAEHPEQLDNHLLGQIKVQLLDLITVTELLIVNNQAPSFPPPSLDGLSPDHQN
ncbi:hypothetical protein [Larkinella terrae]|uniref:Histidine kinase n=1 Tax=Larkinella terrae TaxID=2025311 RepID=A0A7K0EF00_9BACT|nr:hypothetical protein [Larkinella terrae]MRS60036.1 hypothetical protein [Larkinella terrae]